jgi:hypothetical protein
MTESPGSNPLRDGIGETEDGVKFVTAAGLGIWSTINLRHQTKTDSYEDANTRQSSRSRSAVKTERESAACIASTTSNVSASRVNGS